MKLSKAKSSYKRLKQLSRGSSVLASIQAFPAKIFFDGQEREERVVLLLRAHPITLVWPILRSFFILAVMGLLLVPLQGLDPATTGINIAVFSIVLILLLVFIFLTISFYTFSKWFFNVFIITNSRIVDLDFPSINVARWSGAPLDRIEDVTHVPGGFWSVLFDYGNVFVQTAGERPEFEISSIPRPRTVQDILIDLAETSRGK